MTFRALTWDHPRGYLALEAAAQKWAAADGLDITWERQPLEGFESHPIADLCARYDVLVLDHPHLGEAIEADALLPLDELFEPAVFEDLRRNTIGSCLQSYEWQGRPWGLPLDAACQVMACRPDILGKSRPTTWDGIGALARSTSKVALSLGGPHSLLTLISMALSFGGRPSVAGEDQFLPEVEGRAAIELLYELSAYGPRGSRDNNPIQLLERMSTSDDLILIPLVFGYVSYSDPGRPRPLGFFDVPTARDSGPLGSILGGTGIALTRRCKPSPQLLTHLQRLMGPQAQCAFVPNHGGQPSRRDAWHDETVNAAWGNFYVSTAATLEAAFVRPRHAGYMKFQKAAADMVRDAVNLRPPSGLLLDQINGLYRQSLKA